MRLIWQNIYKNLNRFGLLLLFVISSLSLSLSPFFTNSASATSIYDNVIRQATNISLKDSGGLCDEVDYSSNWATDLVLSDDYSWSIGSTNRDQAQDMFEDTKVEWGVSQFISESTGQKSIFVWWTEDQHNNVLWESPGGTFQRLRLQYTSGSGFLASAFFIMDSSCNVVVSGSQYDNDVMYPQIATDQDDGWWVAFATTIDPITLPSGYEGLIIPDTFTPPITKDKLYPSMSMSIDENNDVIFTYQGTFTTDFGVEIEGLQPDYLLFTLEDSTPTIITPDQDVGYSARYNNLPDGNYTIHFDAVFNDYETDPYWEDYELATTEFEFTASHTAYTVIYNPSENKYCSVRNGVEWNCLISQPFDEDKEPITGDPEVWEEEECDLTHLQGCVNNILHWLGEYLGINGPSVKPGSSPFLQFDTNTFGLTAILTAPITILTDLSLSEFTCSPISLPLPYLDDDLSLPCMNAYYSTYLGDLYTLWQTVINGLVAYWVIVGLLRMVKDAKDPQKDQIEVLSL